MTTTHAGPAQNADDKAGSMQKLGKYLLGNLKAFRPTDVFTKVDHAWIKHASIALGISLNTTLDEKTTAKKIARAGEKAKKATAEDVKKHPEAYQQEGLLTILESFKREWQIEDKTYVELQQTLRTLQNLEIMRFTDTGQNSLSAASSTLDTLVKTINTEPARWRAVDELVRTSETTADGAVSLPAAIAFKQYMAESMVRAEGMIRRLEQMESDSLDALMFESIKAYVIAHPSEAHQQLETDLVVMEQSYDAASSALGLAGEAAQLSGSAKNAIKALQAVSDAGIAFLKRSMIAASNEKQVREIMAKSGAEKEAALNEIVQEFDKKPLQVAEMLADKYVRQIQFNLDMLEPLACASLMGIGAGLDTVGAGAATTGGEIIWSLLKITIIETAKEFQAERLELARALETTTKEKYVEASDNYWKKWSNGLTDSVTEKFKTRFVSSGLNLPKTLAESLYGSTVAVLVKEALQHVKIDPAQRFSGQDFLRHVASLQNTRLRAMQSVDKTGAAA
ncbi:hypothetical protein FB561_0460 [Kribbella amoyensis]|uniref:Uncharacterized protein n=1 Tax=Kribbella amoyensis TaxID=996641 RepID=A0A561BKV6_9ACTN|nr:hypothetical protein [Kribbella amoyensis]TWD79402.1 hypothetical protein FB561_0460 [Kribbella amoyensis]